MSAQRRRDREPEYEGGAQPVPDIPPDEPGPARGPVFLLVALLAFLSLLMPILWGLGALTTVGEAVGTGGLIALWVVWAICVIAFLWLLRSLWHRAA